jgi:hypothetical protein
MQYQTPTPPVKGPRRKGLLGLGIVLLIGGVGAGAALFVTSGSTYEDAVKGLQRAPVGCDTEFDFTGTGTFIIYTETKGTIGDLRGDCENTGASYDHGSGRISVDLSMTNSDGDDVSLTRASGASYDKGGFVGSEVREVTIDTPGTYTLSVVSDDSDFAIAVGRNPKDDFDSMQAIAIGAAIAGLVIGGLLIILGLRRKAAPAGPSSLAPGGFAPNPTFNASGYNPGGYPPVQQPSSPPGWTPAAPPSGPPTYAEPGPTPPPFGAQSPYPPQPEPPNPWGAPQQ